MLQYKFNLYVEVKRTMKEEIIDEIVDEKRMWMKVDDITKEIYNKSYKTTGDEKRIILTTMDYVPEYLKGFKNNYRK